MIRHGEYSIRMADRSDRSGFLELHHSVFGSWATADATDVFTWKYVENPYVEELPVIVVTRDGEIVGGRGYTAFELCVGERTVRGLQSGDLMVHPDHRRRGLFSQMNALGLERYDHALFFSCPAKAPRQGYQEDGWDRVSNPQFVRLSGRRKATSRWPLDLLDLLERGYGWLYDRYTTGLAVAQSSSDEYDVEGRDQLPVEELVALYEQQPPSGIHAHRTAEFYRWRFASPLYETTTYLTRDERGVSAAVVIDHTDESVIVREMAPFVRSTEALFAILAHVRTEFPDREMLAWPLSGHRSVLYRTGFLPKEITPHAGRTSDIVVNETGVPTSDGNSITDPGNWALQLAERDY